jgi:hypothetical protein
MEWNDTLGNAVQKVKGIAGREILNPADDALAHDSFTPAVEDRHRSTYDAVTAHAEIEPDVAGL